MSHGRRAQGGGIPWERIRRMPRHLVLPVLTLLLILGGAAMPFAAARLMDGEDRTEVRSFGMTELALHQEVEVGQVLRLIAEGGTWLDWQSGTRLTEETALEAAIAALREMAGDGLVDGDLVKVLSKTESLFSASAVPFLVVSSSTRDLSALVWDISMEADKEGRMQSYLLIDDASGMMLRASVPRSGTWETDGWDAPIPPENESLYINGQAAGQGGAEEQLKTCMGFFSRYYDLPIQRSELVHQGEDVVAYFLYFDLGEELGECQVQLTLDSWYLSFN